MQGGSQHPINKRVSNIPQMKLSEKQCCLKAWCTRKLRLYFTSQLQTGYDIKGRKIKNLGAIMRRFHLEHCHPVLAEIPCWLHFEADCFEASPQSKIQVPSSVTSMLPPVFVNLLEKQQALTSSTCVIREASTPEPLLEILCDTIGKLWFGSKE